MYFKYYTIFVAVFVQKTHSHAIRHLPPWVQKSKVNCCYLLVFA